MATITVTPTFTFGGTSCQGPSKSFTITVNPTAQVNKPADQVICNTASTTQVTFSTQNTGGTTTCTWVNNTPSIGLAASGNGDISSFTATNSGTSPVVATITVTPHFEHNSVTCDGPTTSFTITVNPSAQVDQPTNQTVCHNATTNQVTFSTTSTGGTTTYSWTNDNTSIGLAASGTGDIPSFTVTNTATAPVVATIVVTPHFENGSVSCTGAAKTFTITVNPLGQVNQPGNQVVCHNASTSMVTFATLNTIGTTTYNWTNDNTSIGLAASGTGDINPFTAINTGLSPVTGTITVTPFFTHNGVTCQGPVKIFTITVNPPAQVNQPASQVICHNALSTQVTFTTNLTGGTTTYSWTNDNTSIGLAASGNGNITAFTASNPGLVPVVATIVVTPHFDNGTTICDGPTKSFTITVNPLGHVVQPDNQTVCNNASTSTVVFSSLNTGGTITYAWSNDNTSIGLAASGTGDIAAFTALNGGTTPVMATITVTPTFTNGANACVGSTKVFTITVNPTPDVAFSSASTPVICSGTQASILFSSQVAGTIFNWNVPSLPPGVTMTATSGAGNVNETITNSSNVIATVVFQVMPVAASCSPANPYTYSVVVNPTPLVQFPASPPNPQTVCSASNTMVAVALATNILAPAVISYNWTAMAYDNFNNPTAAINGFLTPNSGNTIPGENLASTLLEPGYVMYSLIATITTSGLACQGPTAFYQVNVNPSPTAQPSIANQSICSQSAYQQVNFTANVSPVTYTWTAINVSGVSGAITSGTTDNIPPTILQTTALAQGTVRYEITPIYSGGGGFGCPGGVSYSTIFVNPNPTIPVITGGSGPGAGHIECENQPSVPYSVPNISGHTYSWTLSGGSISGPSVNNSVLVNWGPANPSAWIQVTDTDLNYATACTSTSTVYNVTITPRPVPVISSAVSGGICQGQTGNYTTANGMSLYDWTIPSDGTIISGGDGFAYVNIRWNTPGTRTIYVNYRNNYNCDGLPPGGALTFPVNPLPDVTIAGTATSTVCQDFPTPYSYSTSVIDPTASYTWSIPLGNGAISPSANANPITINWSSAGAAQLRVNAITALGCSDSKTIPVTVAAKPNVSFTPCFDLTTTLNAKPIQLRGGLPVGSTGIYSVGAPVVNPATYFTPSSLGSHNIYFSFTNASGCIASTPAVTITVLDPATLFSGCGSTLTDKRENPPKLYKTVQIGAQCWMQENLRFGSNASYLSPQTDNCIFERYCLSSDANCVTYGGLYQWDELMHYNGTDRAQGFCPPGWHVPNESEWNTLINNISLGVGNGVAGSYLKDLNTLGQFKAESSGVVYLNNLEAFLSGTLRGSFFWTSSPGATDRFVARGLNTLAPSISRYEASKADAFQVRCVKD